MKGKMILFVPSAIFGTLFPLFNPNVTLLIFFLYIFILVKYKRFTTGMLIVFSLLSVCFAALAAVSGQSHSSLSGTEERLFIDFREGASIDGDSFRAFAIEPESGEKLAVSYRIKSEKEKTLLAGTDFFERRCFASGKLKEPPAARNPNAFDYKNYLKRKEIHWIFEIDDAPVHQCGPSEASIKERLGKLRKEGIVKLRESLPFETSTFATALIFGDQSAFPEDIEAAYRNLGITHLLAISGTQVTMLAGIALYIGIRAGIARERMSLLLLVLLPLYAILAGASPSVNRAVMMACILIPGSEKVFQSAITPSDALSLTFMAYILFNPNTIYDPGFQLSYAVTFALLFSWKRMGEKGRGGVHVLAVSTFISQLASLPIVLLHFHSIPIISIAANLIFIPLYSFILLPSVYILFPFIYLGASFEQPLVLLVNKAVIFSERLALLLGRFPLRLAPGYLGGGQTLLYGALVAFAFIAWEKTASWRRGLLALFLPFIVVAVIGSINGPPYWKGEITMIDVGQGESILISLPGGKGNYLIDTGGSVQFGQKPWQKRTKIYDPGRDAVLPYLRAKGIMKLDKLILTHGDQDHIGGAPALIDGMAIDEIILPAAMDKSNLEKDIITLAIKKHIKIVEVSRGDKWRAGGTNFFILSPESGYKGERNGGSIGIYAKIGGKRWLFSGDMEEGAELELMENYPGLKIDVMKIGHHGSRTSSSEQFLNHYKPQIALISVGVNNRFGHPHVETLTRLEKLGAIIYRTDQMGAITFTFQGNTGTFSAAIPYYTSSERKAEKP